MIGKSQNFAAALNGLGGLKISESILAWNETFICKDADWNSRTAIARICY